LWVSEPEGPREWPRTSEPIHSVRWVKERKSDKCNHNYPIHAHTQKMRKRSKRRNIIIIK
jgi:hypothetical protein